MDHHYLNSRTNQGYILWQPYWSDNFCTVYTLNRKDPSRYTSAKDFEVKEEAERWLEDQEAYALDT